jgi:ParB-like nuclease domain
MPHKKFQKAVEQLHVSATIEHWPLMRLVPYQHNPRTHSAAQVEQIANSIQEFGFTNPILVDGDAGRSSTEYNPATSRGTVRVAGCKSSFKLSPQGADQ